ncbi:MAG: glycosyltransferase family 2 protein [Bacteroidales bacterium]|nr:glycosyltransferase family 2 protein [Bacteroidales bacterium]
MVKITAIIPTGNEEENIEKAIQSVQFVDEIIVVDSFSTDRTVEIAKKYTPRVIQHEYVNSATQKNWTIPQASHNWILLLDADERVTPELQEEIQELLQNEPEEVAYWIYRKNYFMGRHLKHGGWNRDKVIRLFRKDKCGYEEKHVHAEIIANGKTGILKNKLIHNTYPGFDRYVAKVNRYSWWSARDYDKKIGKLSCYHFFVKPSFRFFKHYILQGGFRDGIPGLTVAFLAFYALMTRYIKLWLIRNNSLEDNKQINL